MRRPFRISVFLLIALVGSACAPETGPRQVVGAPNPVYYGACTPTTVRFSYEWQDTTPSGGLAPPPQIPFVNVHYQLLGPGGTEVTSGVVNLSHSLVVPVDVPMESAASVDLYSGALSMNPMAPLLKGGAGSLVFYAQEMFPPADKGSGDPRFYFTGATSDTKVVSVLPCAPTPTPAWTPTPTETPTATPVPVGKPKREDREEPPCGPNDPNCQQP